jgi:hypothetical protein
MLTKQQVLEQVKAGRKSDTLDSRDYGRLANFFETEHLEALGFGLADDADPVERDKNIFEWTEENVLVQLASDLKFGFEKALNQRGISAGLMHGVVTMWMWVLEDELYGKADDMYAQYGLPFFKAVALKYNLPNEIGEDAGDEDKYACQY